MEEDNWLDGIKKRRRKKFVRALICVVLTLAVWFILTGLWVWAWVAVFHQLPPGYSFFEIYFGIGSAIITFVAPYLPLFPMKGEYPEVIAADEFFKGPQR